LPGFCAIAAPAVNKRITAKKFFIVSVLQAVRTKIRFIFYSNYFYSYTLRVMLS
jgi:hypothetical protein